MANVNTKAEQEAEIARLERIAFLRGSIAAPAASVAAPAKTAKVAAPKPQPETPKAPRARTASVITITADPAKGQNFAPFKVLQTSNGVNGMYHRGSRLTVEDVIAVLQWANTPEGLAFCKTRTL